MNMTEQIQSNTKTILRTWMRNNWRDWRHPVGASQWMEDNYVLPDESGAVTGSWRGTKYQRDLSEVAAKLDRPQRIVFLKSARIGYTATLIGVMLYLFVRLRRQLLMMMPTDVDAREFAKDALKPAVMSCDVARETIDETDTLARSISVGMFKIAGKVLYVRGCQSARNLRRISPDLALLDELDGYAQNVGGEGSPVELAMTRTKASPYRRMIAGGTPTNEETSMTWAEYQGCELKLDFHVPCPHCSVMQKLIWEGIKFDAEGTVDERADSVRYCGECCGAEWRWEDLPKVLENGAWRSEDGLTVVCDPPRPPRLLREDGSEAEWPRRVGMHLWAAYNPFAPWSDLVEMFLRSQGDVNKLKVFTNTMLGLPWRDRDSAANEVGMRARRFDSHSLPDGVKSLVVAIDVQGDWLSVMTTGWGDGETVWIVDRFNFYGDIDTPGEGAWLDLEDWLRSDPTWRRGDRNFGINALAIDTGGSDTQAVYREFFRIRDILKARRAKTFAVKGEGRGWDRPIVAGKPTRRSVAGVGRKIPLHIVGTNQAKNQVVSLLNTDSRSQFATGLPDEVFKELAAEELRTETVKGRRIKTWVQIHDRNEALDCLVYALAVTRLLTPRDFALREGRGSSEPPVKAAEPKPVVDDGVRESRLKKRRRRASPPRRRRVW